ncbi:unnamed protein product, partial [Ectocarpus fasciculatus]
MRIDGADGEEAPTRAEVLRLKNRVDALEEQLKESKDDLAAMQERVQGVATTQGAVKQVLGMAGLAESIFEVVYISIEYEQGNLQSFETFFFALLAGAEFCGELFVFL